MRCLDQECVKIGGLFGMLFEIGDGNGWERVEFIYVKERPVILEGDLVELCVDGNWEI